MSVESSQVTQRPSEAAEPRAVKRAVPVWILILLLLLIYWGMLFFDQHGGWFSQEVYAPFNSFAQVEVLQPATEGGNILKGKQLFNLNCAVCHMENGTGNPANGCPPLDGSEWVKAPGYGRIIRIISKGLTGPIEVKGQTYSIGTMLPIGDQMLGDEKQKAEDIAAIIFYIRKTFGGVSTPVKPEQVQAVRATINNHNTSFTVDEVKAVPENE